MRTLALFVLLASLLSGCMADRPPIEPRTTYSQIGATVRSPNDLGWKLMSANAGGVALGKQLEGGATAVAVTTIIEVGDIGSDRAFLDHIAKERSDENNNDTSRFTILSVKNQQVSFKDTRCLKYDVISQDHKARTTATGTQFTKNTGYICRHPADRSAALFMEMSVRSGEKTFPANIRPIARDFFAGVTLTGDGL